MSIRICCEHHANIDAADETMLADEQARVHWLEENGNIFYHYQCKIGRTWDFSNSTTVLGVYNNSPALFQRDDNGEEGEFIKQVSNCPECGQKLTTEDKSGYPNHYGNP